MRLSNTQAVARPVPADRTPTLVVATGFNRGVAPHADTVRWTYTVPAGRSALAEYLFNKARRVTVATTPGDFQTYIQYTKSGGGLQIIHEEISNGNVIENAHGDTLGQFGTMLSGDRIEQHTSDLSTGGLVDYLSGFKATEYAT